MIRKDVRKLVEICNRNKGRIVHRKQALSILGYKSTTKFYNTYAQNLVRPVNRYTVEFGEWILTEESLSSEIVINIPINWWWNYFDRERLYLYPRESVPWWMLKEYGGRL